ncbi:UPF0193 protein EVG1 homolog isoform X1 [Acanthaster planci]|uniref:UPF0193 protein EVG1 homolog isoform X1 n=1 Tax=Acanthaster planci TaxID=133434 RepID=A0A8B7XHS8_ACAPL|nr:UPF0193 protein EVG1 homolog isoform X1 [Acanthaster planci]
MSAGKQRGVAKGGMWNTQTPQYSNETQQLLKVMMQESKLNAFQQRQLKEAMKGGGALPMRCNPTTSAKPCAPSAAKPKSIRVDPRGHSGGLRKKEDIEDSGAYERQQYRPSPQKSLEKEKGRLQNIMAFGEDKPPVTEERRKELLQAPTPEPEPDRFTELEAEIRERAEFLEDMTRLGKGKEYQAIIATEISQKLREMEVIDKKRTAQLHKAIQAKEQQTINPVPTEGGDGN